MGDRVVPVFVKGSEQLLQAFLNTMHLDQRIDTVRSLGKKTDTSALFAPRGSKTLSKTYVGRSLVKGRGVTRHSFLVSLFNGLL